MGLETYVVRDKESRQLKVSRSFPQPGTVTFGIICRLLTDPAFCFLIRAFMRDKIRVAGGQGFWGDLLTAPVDQVRNGPIDYLMLDYLAEVTMSILQKQRSRDPNAGYAKDFVTLMGEILPDCVEKNIKVLSNAGGVNVTGCADAIRETAQQLGLG